MSRWSALTGIDDAARRAYEAYIRSYSDRELNGIIKPDWWILSSEAQDAWKEVAIAVRQNIEPARLAYEAYYRATGGKGSTGLPMQGWWQLSVSVQDAWGEAARAALTWSR